MVYCGLRLKHLSYGAISVMINPFFQIDLCMYIRLFNLIESQTFSWINHEITTQKRKKKKSYLRPALFSVFFFLCFHFLSVCLLSFPNLWFHFLTPYVLSSLLLDFSLPFSVYFIYIPSVFLISVKSLIKLVLSSTWLCVLFLNLQLRSTLAFGMGIFFLSHT